MNATIWQSDWLSKKTFWQINLAVGLPMMVIFLFFSTGSHWLIYQFEHGLNSLAAQIGVDAGHEPLAMLILCFSVVFFVALRYSKLAEKLKINRLILYTILLGNAGLLWAAILHYAPGSVQVFTDNNLGVFMSFLSGHLIRTSFWLAIVGLIATLLWHDVIKPRPALKSLALKLIQPQPNNPPTSSRLAKGIAIAMLIGLMPIAFHLYKNEVAQYHRMEKALLKTTQLPLGKSPDFDLVNWRDAINLTAPALAAEKNQDWAKAVTEWTKLHDLYPYDIGVLQHRADAYHALGQYPLARVDALHVTKLAKNDARGWQSLCRNTLLSGRFDQARDNCQQARQLDPWDYQNALNLAHSTLLAGNSNAAKQAYAQAVSMVSTHAELQTMLDDFAVLEQLGVHHEALAQAKQSLAQQGNIWLHRLAPANRHLQQAQAAEEKGEIAQATVLYQQHVDALQAIAGAQHPQTLLAMQQLALLHTTQGQYTAAEALFKQLQTRIENAYGKQHPVMMHLLNDYGYMLYQANRQQEAANTYSQALTIGQAVYGDKSPETATALNGLGSLSRKQGKSDFAELALQQAVDVSIRQLLPDYQRLAKRMNNLGLFYFDAGNDLLAENYFRNALEMTELSVGANHPDIFWRLHNLCLLYTSRCV